MNAIERAQELMYTKNSELPPEASSFKYYLAKQYGMCMEVCLTAFAVYAQIVEGLTCDDSLYQPNEQAVSFFKDLGYSYNGITQDLGHE